VEGGEHSIYYYCMSKTRVPLIWNTLYTDSEWSVGQDQDTVIVIQIVALGLSVCWKSR
jgi:hypothetical protein